MAVVKKLLKLTLPAKQASLFCSPYLQISHDFKKIYYKKQIQLGWPRGEKKIFDHVSRKNTAAIVGAALGDEGKGRLVDNKIESLLKRPGIKKVYVIRFQGGNNTGHTVEKNGIKLALHLVPSGVMYKKTIGIMDRGMVIHPEDLQTEINYTEEKVGSLNNRLFLSEEAILCTDLERAEETLNTMKEGKAKGGTGRGISPAYAHHYDRLGLKIYNLVQENWLETLGKQYDRYQKEFIVYNLKLADIDVPDFKTTHQEKKARLRKVGSKEEFLARLAKVRTWLINRNFIRNTFPLHQKIDQDKSIAILFEGAQAAGLDPWLGTRPDVTSSNTSAYGLREGTAYWRIQDVAERIGVFKIPYTSSVGARKMPTHVDLPKDLKDLPPDASPDQKWAAYVRETAHEYGTTTGRPRDINCLDLAFLIYNAHMSGIEMLAGTHLDTAIESQTIKVCTHYTDQKGNYLPYQPGLRYQKNVIPHYIELPGWDGAYCRKAKSIKQLPINALKFLSFIQVRTGFPVVVVTTGPERKNLLALNGY